MMQSREETRARAEDILPKMEEDKKTMTVDEACAKHGITQATYYNWKSRWPEFSSGVVKPKRKYTKRAPTPIVIEAAPTPSKMAVVFGSPSEIAEMIKTMGV